MNELVDLRWKLELSWEQSSIAVDSPEDKYIVKNLFLLTKIFKTLFESPIS